MRSIKRALLIFLGVFIFSGAPVNAHETAVGEYELKLSPEIMELLRAEMRAILTAVQYLPEGIASADWKKVAQTGAQISASYILEQKLTPAMKTELEHTLPGNFKRLDQDFHHEAKKLEAAARSHNAQLAAFHYYRMIETCTHCHATFAAARFPGFASTSTKKHGH